MTDVNWARVAEDVVDAMQDLAGNVHAVGISPNEVDSNGEPANVVDGLYEIARAIHRLAAAVEAK